MTERSCSRSDAENLRVIVGFCEAIGQLVELHGSKEGDFRDNISLQFGCAFALEQIGESVKRLSSELRASHHEVEWRKAAAMRDFIAHSYANVDLSIMRTTVLAVIPSFEKDCRRILDSLGDP
ncbi:MAG: DUF86 domain-containing protein [Methanomassiliicoccaceae archaeon]|nr:DUF86 domain-containing protein [Methanomassiliicoccaceae archaeon]